jgi:uncharacterized membrane protein (UPF0127 family)
MKINFKGKDIEIPDVKTCNWFMKFKGLMLCRREKARALLFEFRSPVNFHLTSLFVFFPFVAIWLGEKNEIIKMKKIKPFTFEIPFSKFYRKILEIPINKKYLEIVQSLDES